ncbi:MAG: hypothetical protein KDB36_16810, partial [Acidimicrobiales bacterium]|nr:hypothetical protein [Acidimicrobiales bacterium]
HPAHDTVQIAAGIDPVLDLPGAEEDDNATGDIDITTAITIEGGGATIDAAGLDRAIDTYQADVVLRDLEVVNGSADDGFLPASGVRSFTGALDLDGVTLRSGSAPMQASLVVSFVDHVSVVDSSIEAAEADMAAALFGEHITVERSSIAMASGFGAALVVGGVTISIDASTMDGGPNGMALHFYCCPEDGSPNAVSINRSTLHAPGNAAVVVEGGTVEVSASTVIGLPGILHGVGVVRSRGSIISSCSGGSLDSGGWNLVGGACGAASIGDQEGVGDVVGMLGDHGGPTSTMLLFDNAPGVDAIPVGTPGLCDGGTDTDDQRGVPRPVGGGCDAGAVEGSGGMAPGTVPR